MVPSELKEIFVTASKASGFPPELLAAIAWRESCFGKTLDAEGYGDGKHGFGLMQVDVRSHKPLGGPLSLEHVQQATAILNDMRNIMRHEHPDWTAAEQLRGAVAAYNAGPGNIKTVAHMDVGTTGNDYSADVLSKAAILRPQFVGA